MPKVTIIFTIALSFMLVSPIMAQDQGTGSKQETGSLYEKVGIVPLDKISEGDYGDYSRYVHNGNAYIIVHPAYYLFFHDSNENKTVLERKNGDFSKNMVDTFVDDYPAGDNMVLKLMKESARRERDFIKKNSSAKRLTILVLPANYLDHPEYPYRERDEFARYLNEVTAGSPSVIYVESEKPNEGRLKPEGMARLLKFLYAAKVKSVLLGGGYKELCLTDFQESIQEEFKSVKLLPEICTESPDLLNE